MANRTLSTGTAPHLCSLTHRINGLQLHTLHRPAAGSPKVLLLHGWMDCAASFRFFIEHLDACWDVYALDWRGCGLSEHQKHGYYDRAVMLSDLAQWIDLVSPNEPVHLLGHSLGGMLAAHYAGVMPQRVRSLVVAEGFGVADESADAAARKSARFLTAMSQPKHWYDLGSLNDVAEKFRQRNPLLTPERAHYFAEILTRTTPSGSLNYRADIKHKLPQPFPYRLDAVFAVWRQITAPRLWVQGGFVPHNHYLLHIRDTLPERHAALGSPPQIVIPEAGHMLHWETPEKLADAAQHFWRQHQPRSTAA